MTPCLLSEVADLWRTKAKAHSIGAFKDIADTYESCANDLIKFKLLDEKKAEAVADGLEELRAMSKRLKELSQNGYADMEGADLRDFMEAEALYTNCESAAMNIDRCIRWMLKARSKP